MALSREEKTVGKMENGIKKEKRIKFVEDTRTLLQIVPGRPSFGMRPPRGGSMMGANPEGRNAQKSLGTEGLARILHAQDRQRTYKEKGTGTRCIKHRTPISYEMYFEPEHYRFYLSVPTASYRSVSEHVKKAWPGAGVKVEEEDYLEMFEEQPASYCEIKMGKYYIFPLNFASGEPLNSLINVAKGLKAGEKMMFQTMMIPLKTSWQIKARDVFNTYEETGISVPGSGFEGVLKSMEDEVIEVFDILTGSLLGLKEEEKKKKVALKPADRELEAVRSKISESAFKCMMRVFVIAETQGRRNEILTDVANALRAVEGRNLLEMSAIHYQVPLDLTKRYSGVAQELSFNRNVLTISEMAGLLQAPDQGTLERNPQIRRSDQQEVPVPKEMYDGVIPIGIINPLDPKILYWNHRDMERFITTKVLMGAPGSGKTTYLQLLINRFYALRQSVFIFDIIKQCEFTKEVEESLDPSAYVVWDFSKADFYNHFSFNYCELYRDYEEDNFMKRQVIASYIQKQIVNFLDAMNANAQPLTPKMKRYLESVAQIVFVHKDQTLNDFMKVLSDYETRQKYLRKCENVRNSEGYLLVPEDIIRDVRALDKQEKIVDENGEEDFVWTTDETKVDAILTRLHVLKSDPRVRRMLENPVTEDYDLQSIILDPKVVMIRVPQQKNAVTGEYGYSEEIRSMITAFITFKLWLIKEALGCEGDEEELVENLLGEQVKRKDLHVVHMMYDEVHQIPQTIEMLAVHLKEFRKFRLGAIFTCHGITNFSKSAQEALQQIGTAYLLLSPTEHETVDKLKTCFSNIDPQDIKEMERHHVAAYVPAGSAYIGVMGRSPGLIKDFLALEQELKTKSVKVKRSRKKLTPSQRFFAQLEGAGICLEKAENAPIDKLINFVSKLFEKEACQKGFVEEELSGEMTKLLLTHEPDVLTEDEAAQLEACEFEEGTHLIVDDQAPLVKCQTQSNPSVVKFFHRFLKGATIKKAAVAPSKSPDLGSQTVKVESKGDESVPTSSPRWQEEANPFVQKAREQALRYRNRLSEVEKSPEKNIQPTSVPTSEKEPVTVEKKDKPSDYIDVGAIVRRSPRKETGDELSLTSTPTQPIIPNETTLDWGEFFNAEASNR